MFKSNSNGIGIDSPRSSVRSRRSRYGLAVLAGVAAVAMMGPKAEATAEHPGWRNPPGIDQASAPSILHAAQSLRPEATITPSGGFVCASGRIQISPPRVYASYRTQQVLWRITVLRLNTSSLQWYQYGVYDTYSSFDTYGRSATSWSGSFVNSKYQIPVYHSGSYRVFSAVAVSDGSSNGGWLNGGSSCAFT